MDFDNLEVYEILLKSCKQFATQPSSSIESEDFFRELLKKYTGTVQGIPFEDWLFKQLNKFFKGFNNNMPKWIQDPEWPYSNGIPMTFVGQFNIVPSDNSNTDIVFHDSTSLYVFVGVKSPPVVIMQQY